MKRFSILLALLVAAGLPHATFGEEALAPEETPSLEAPAASSETSLDTQLPFELPQPVFETSQSTNALCRADCKGYGSAECSDSSSCRGARDQDCAAGIRGYARCSTFVYRWCDPCPTVPPPPSGGGLCEVGGPCYPICGETGGHMSNTGVCQCC